MTKVVMTMLRSSEKESESLVDIISRTIYW